MEFPETPFSHRGCFTIPTEECLYGTRQGGMMPLRLRLGSIFYSLARFFG